MWGWQIFKASRSALSSAYRKTREEGTANQPALVPREGLSSESSDAPLVNNNTSLTISKLLLTSSSVLERLSSGLPAVGAIQQAAICLRTGAIPGAAVHCGAPTWRNNGPLRAEKRWQLNLNLVGLFQSLFTLQQSDYGKRTVLTMAVCWVRNSKQRILDDSQDTTFVSRYHFSLRLSTGRRQ